MRAYVFTDTSLARHAGRFVWLDLDNEKARNAPFRKRYPVQALPTFWVIDPRDEQVAVRWVGAMSLAQLHQLLESDVLAGTRGRGSGALARADSLFGAGDNAGAATAYRDALGGLPAASPARARAFEAMLYALSNAGAHETLARAAFESLEQWRGTTTGASAAAYGLDAAIALPREHPRRAAWIAALEAEARRVLADTTLALADDDRSGVHIAVVSAREDAGDAAGKLAAARAWAAFLESAAGRARTPEQRTVFDSHRLSAYLELGEPARAVPMLEQSRRDFPDDYNPWARLAGAYRAMKRWDEARAASDSALARAYGPRRLLILQNRADIEAGRGDSTAWRATLEVALREAEALPEGQRSPRTIEALKQKLASGAR